jgi:inorganic pyrophosphatase
MHLPADMRVFRQTSRRASFDSFVIASPITVSPLEFPEQPARDSAYCARHPGYIWNYGAFPQTWEDPQVKHAETGANGDNDPLDVCEIGEALGYVGQIKQVKVLGIMALLDEGETDWKVLVVDVNDPLAPRLNDIEDVERRLPGLIRATNEWFRIYKIPDGKPEVRGETVRKRRIDGAVERLRLQWRGQVEEVRGRDHPRVPRGLAEAHDGRVGREDRGIPSGHVSCIFRIPALFAQVCDV